MFTRGERVVIGSASFIGAMALDKMQFVFLGGEDYIITFGAITFGCLLGMIVGVSFIGLARTLDQ